MIGKGTTTLLTTQEPILPHTAISALFVLISYRNKSPIAA